MPPVNFPGLQGKGGKKFQKMRRGGESLTKVRFTVAELHTKRRKIEKKKSQEELR